MPSRIIFFWQSNYEGDRQRALDLINEAANGRPQYVIQDRLNDKGYNILEVDFGK